MVLIGTTGYVNFMLITDTLAEEVPFKIMMYLCYCRVYFNVDPSGHRMW